MDESLFSFCTGPRKDVAYGLMDLVKRHPEEVISQKLIAAVSEGRVPASIIAIWLNVSEPAGKIVDALRQDQSRLARQHAISQYGKRLWSNNWKLVWDEVGGVAGLLELLATFSVAEVKQVMHLLSRCNKKHTDEEKAEKITQLLQSLLSHLYPDAPCRNEDDRPLYRQYARLVPACTTTFVRAVLYDSSHPVRQYFPGDQDIQTCDGKILQQLALDHIFSGHESGSFSEDMQRVPFQYTPHGRDDSTGLSQSMTFSLLVLRKLATRSNANISMHAIQNHLIGPLWRRALRKHRARKYLLEIIELTIQSLKRRTVSLGSLDTEKNSMLHYLVSGWSREPRRYEPYLVDFLELHGSNGRGRFDAFKQLSSLIQRLPQRYWLLRLFLLHDKCQPTDITEEGDLKSSRLLWHPDLFLRLNQDDALVLLRRLLRAKPAADFLEMSRNDTILAQRPTPSSGHADSTILLTLLERGHDGALDRAKLAVDARRKKAATSREQAERAFYAVSALMTAIAGGDLPLYSETVNWSRRYIRDALSSQMVFGKSTTKTIEGITLLSGIPTGNLRNTPLDSIRQRVVQANETIFTFLNIYAEAQREPHFRKKDWSTVLDLSEVVLDTRAKHAVDVQKHFNLSNHSLYTTLWAETLTTFIGLKGHEGKARRLYNRVSDIIPTTALLTLATTALDRLITLAPSETENIAPLEHLSYALLSALATSDQPTSATPLILRSVIDRPDASSWHRRALSGKLLQRLPASSAQSLLLDFARSIGQKLSAPQAAASKHQDAKVPNGGVIVGVTTVKYLAQLLDGAEFISPGFAVTVLTALLKDASHLDIRIAVVESMLKMLEACTTDSMTPLASKLLDGLEETIPVISALNERRPLTEAEWAEAENSGVLPEVYADGGMGTLPPLLGKLVRWDEGGRSRWRRQVVQRVILPAVENSVESQRRWAGLFWAKHSPSSNTQGKRTSWTGLGQGKHRRAGSRSHASASTAASLPSLPVKPALLSTLLTSSLPLLPSSILSMHQQFILTNISPPPEIKALTAKVLNDPVLRQSNEGQYWLTVTQTLAQIEMKDGITLAQVQTVLLEQADALVSAAEPGSLLLGDEKAHSWHHLTGQFQAGVSPLETSLPEDERNAWLGQARPVLQAMIENVETIRTADWQRQKDRKPSMLPNTLEERCWLMSYPALACSKDNRDEGKVGKACGQFAMEGNAQIEALAARNLPYGDGLEVLKKAVKRIEPNIRARVALALLEENQLEDVVGMTVLRALIGEELLIHAVWDAEGRGAEVEATRRAVDQWRESSVEEVRMVGWRVWRALKAKESRLFEN